MQHMYNHRQRDSHYLVFYVPEFHHLISINL